MVIAVDFDGTLVEHEYPKIGKEKLFAFETLKQLQKEEHRLILWTIRTGKELEDAVEYCKNKGIEFYAVNKNYPEEEYAEGEISRKVNADIFIDDRNVGGFHGWSAIYQMLNEAGALSHAMEMQQNEASAKKGSFLSRIFGK